MRSEEALAARADAVIVGGGIVGCATAYYLAKRGMSVVLLEKDEIGARNRAATGASSGSRDATHSSCR